MTKDLKRRMRAALKPKEPTGELVAADWGRARDAMLSCASTEAAIAQDLLAHERQAAQINAKIAEARSKVAEAFKQAGLPFSPYERNYRWDTEQKAVYLLPKGSAEVVDGCRQRRDRR